MNRTNKGASTNVLQILIDILFVELAFVLDLAFGQWDFTTEEQFGFLLVTLVFTMVLVLSNKANYLYNVTLFYYFDRIFKKILGSFLLAVATTFLMVHYVGAGKEGVQFYIIFLSISFVLNCLKIFINRPLLRLCTKGSVPRAAFLGEIEKFKKFNQFLDKTSIMYEHVGYIARNREIYESTPENYIGCAEDMEEIIRTFHIDEVYIGQKPNMDLGLTQKYLDLCMDMGVTVRMIVDLYKKRNAKSYVSTVGTYPILVYHTIALNTIDRIVKRAMDIAGGIVGVILTSPIMLITAIAIKLDSKGPILFCQTRVGKNGRLFKIYKFRSMRIDAEEIKEKLLSQNEMQGGVMFKIQNDPRITRVGRVIRKLSIDELPQFFNVIGGSMSLVGTRPPTVDEVEKYERNQWRRISIKPGITGMWQVNGRSNVRNFEDIVEMDVEYIDKWSIWLDIKIMFKTVAVVFDHSGAY